MVQTRNQKAEAIAAAMTKSEPKRGKVTRKEATKPDRSLIRKEESASPNRKLTKKERLVQTRENGQEFGKRDKATIQQHNAKNQVIQRSDDGNDDDDDNSRDNNTRPKKRKKIERNRKMAPQEELKENVKLATAPKTQAQAQSLAQNLPSQSILDWTTNAAQSILDWTTKAATASKTPTQKAEVIEIDDDSDSDKDLDEDEDRKPTAKPTLSSAIPRSDGTNNGRKRQRFEERQTQSTIESDMTLAQKLQNEEEEQSKQEIQKEEKAMADNKSGKAVLAVQSIIKLVQDLKEKFPMYADDINEVSVDDMVYLAERLLGQQQDFVNRNIPAYVDLGYHYTSIENTEKICENGLLTKNERAHQNIQVLKKHGSAFGDGIYTANNPIACSGYGAVGLIVARLQGTNVRVPFALKVHNFHVDEDVKSICGDKITEAMIQDEDFNDDGWPTNDYNHEVVLRSSSQVLPLVKYSKTLIKTSKGRKCIQQFESSLQSILDGLFNKGYQQAPMGIIVGDKSRYFSTAIAKMLSQSRAATLREIYVARIDNSSASKPSTSFYYIPFADAITAGLHLQQTRSTPNKHQQLQRRQQQQQQQYQQRLLRARQATNKSATTNAALSSSLPILYQAPNTSVTATANAVNANANAAAAAAAATTTAAAAAATTTATATATAAATSAPSNVSNVGRSNATVQQQQQQQQQQSQQRLIQARQVINNRPNISVTFNSLPILYRAPKTITADDECPICQEVLRPDPCVILAVCNHVFHRSCVEHAFEVKSQCPICRKEIGKPQGKSPSGSMSVSYSSSLCCSGFDFDSTIVVTYSMKSGTQKSYHENPGQSHSGKRTTAYIPGNTEGEKLLKRLKYAFLRGLTFTVGMSLTTGIANKCTWSNIHHKTSLNGGVTAHGYPDSGYLANCNKELDSVNIPPADSLRDDGTEM